LTSNNNAHSATVTELHALSSSSSSSTKIGFISSSHDQTCKQFSFELYLDHLLNTRIKNITHEAVYDGHEGIIESMTLFKSFNSNTEYIASGSSDCLIKIYDVSTGNEVTTLRGHTESVKCLKASNDGLLLASGSVDKLIMLEDEQLQEAGCSSRSHSSC